MVRSPVLRPRVTIYRLKILLYFSAFYLGQIHSFYWKCFFFIFFPKPQVHFYSRKKHKKRSTGTSINPTELRMAKTLLSFGHSECSRVKQGQMHCCPTLWSWKGTFSTWYIIYLSTTAWPNQWPQLKQRTHWSTRLSSRPLKCSIMPHWHDPYVN